MSAAEPSVSTPVPGGPAKLISCILPDDGRDRRLLAWLRDQPGVTRANSVYCRGHSVLQETSARHGRLPEPTLVRLLSLVVETAEANGLFERLYVQADIGRPGGGALMMTPLSFATPFLLPEGVPDEPDELTE